MLGSFPGVRSVISSWVRGSSDARLERTIGSRAGLTLLFRALARRFDPARAEDFSGALQFVLRAGDGEVRGWVVEVGGGRARARPGTAPDPRVTISLGRADFGRIAAGELDPGKALLTGRLDIEGDLAVATRLGEMFGLAGPY